MLKYLPLLLVVGCASVPTIDISDVRQGDPKLLSVLEREPIGKNTYTNQQCANVKYNNRLSDTWQTPSQTVKYGGNCEDISVCFFYANYHKGALLVANDEHIWTEVGDTAYDQQVVYDAMGHRTGRQANYITNDKFSARLK